MAFAPTLASLGKTKAPLAAMPEFQVRNPAWATTFPSSALGESSRHALPTGPRLGSAPSTPPPPPPRGAPAGADTGLGRTEQELRKAVTLLQKDSEEQLQLEQESQSTFEFLVSQVKALRDAFAVLSDVVVEEVDMIRTDLRRQKTEMKQLRADITKVASAHADTAEWATAAEGDITSLKIQAEQELPDRLDGIDKATVRTEVVLESVANRVGAMQKGFDGIEKQLGDAQEQHLHDLGLTQSALEACQRSQKHTEENLQTVGARLAQFEGIAAQIQGAVREQEEEIRLSNEMGQTIASTVEALKNAFA